jgi:hypothetical protein
VITEGQRTVTMHLQHAKELAKKMETSEKESDLRAERTGGLR